MAVALILISTSVQPRVAHAAIIAVNPGEVWLVDYASGWPETFTSEYCTTVGCSFYSQIAMSRYYYSPEQPGFPSTLFPGPGALCGYSDQTVEGVPSFFGFAGFVGGGCNFVGDTNGQGDLQHDYSILTGFNGSFTVISIAADSPTTSTARLLYSPVPLPAALPLLGAGLAGLGFMGWARRRKDAKLARAA